jgi:hypothetical protein
LGEWLLPVPLPGLAGDPLAAVLKTKCRGELGLTATSETAVGGG